jgi:hypothetical protein
VVQQWNGADQALRKALAVAQPGLRDHALHLAPLMPLRDLWRLDQLR